MTLNFVIPEFNIGGAGTPPLQFFRRGFNLNGSGGSEPSWKDIILHGNTALTLVNSKANGLNYLKLFGKCEQNGTPTPDSPVDIVCNNGVIRLLNLANTEESNLDIGNYIDTDGSIKTSKNNFYAISYMPVTPNTEYTILTSSSIAYLNLYEYENDTEQGFIQRTQFRNVSKGTITTGINTRYLRLGANIDSTTLSYAKISAITWILTNGQITADGTVETVEIDSTGDTATAQNLFGLEDCADEQEILKGVITRKIGIKVFNGDESFGSSSAYGTALYMNNPATSWGAAKTKEVMCTHFLGGIKVPSGTQPENTCFFNSSGHFYFRTNMSATNFKAWLADQYIAGTPVIVVYCLSAQKTESTTPQPLSIQTGTNTAEIKQSGINELPLEAGYKSAN